MKSIEINLPGTYSRHTIQLCIYANIYSLQDLIESLKLGKQIKSFTRSSKKSYQEIFNSLPLKVQKEYLDGSIVITNTYTIDYALNRGDQEIFYKFCLDKRISNLAEIDKIDSFKKFMLFLKNENRITELKGADSFLEMAMSSLMPEHIRGWYNRFHVLGLKQNFTSVIPEKDSIDYEFLSQLSPRSKNLAINYGLYNWYHFKDAFAKNIELERFPGIGIGVVSEFNQLVKMEKVFS